jgi:hypothetical protein
MLATQTSTMRENENRFFIVTPDADGIQFLPTVDHYSGKTKCLADLIPGV